MTMMVYCMKVSTDSENTIICVDGLPYHLISNLMDQAVICTTDNCCQEFLTMKEFNSHHQEHHPNLRVKYVPEFDWISLQIGAGHLEHNALKAFTALNWVPFCDHLCTTVRCSTPRAKEFVKSPTDHHLSWKLILIFDSA